MTAVRRPSLFPPGVALLRSGCCLLVAALAALAGLPGRASAADVPPVTEGYRIGPKDLIEIKVFEVPELNVERRVSDDGTITLPLIGDVQAQGLTDTELADRLKALLESKLLQHASVNVVIREYRSRPIVVMGAVRQPGNLAFSGRWTLLEAIAAVGGLDDSNAGMIYVLRRAPNGLTDQVAISVADLMVKADPDVNIPIVANDVINVPATVDVTVFCLGQVKSPGALTFRSTDRITLLTAIARAGGLTDRASKKIQIKRRDASGKDAAIEVDYKRVVAGKDPDVALESGDVIVVKESFF
jgi:polysaccharide biosynthesis/export protein